VSEPDARVEPDTQSAEYTRYLAERRGLRRLVDVQIPYRWNLRRLHLGRVLDVGCGIGRNLRALAPGSVGVDHNPHSIALCNRAGLEALVPADFARAFAHREATFDSLLCAHVVEHMTPSEAVELLGGYRRFLVPRGRAIIITPQEAGFRSDATHVTFCDFEANARLLRDSGFAVERAYSFPFPRAAGRVFAHNEFVTVGVALD